MKTVRLRKSEMNVIADSMIYRTLKSFDMFAFEIETISLEQKQQILNLIGKKADKYINNYCNIGNTTDLINNVIENRV